MFLFIWKGAVDVSFPRKDGGTLMVKDLPVLILSTLSKISSAFVLNLTLAWFC